MQKKSKNWFNKEASSWAFFLFYFLWHTNIMERIDLIECLMKEETYKHINLF